MPLTPDIVRATVIGGVLRGTLQPQSYDRRILKITFTNAPIGTNFTLYKGFQIDNAYLMTTTLIGNRNSYDAGVGSAPMTLFAGEACTLVWSGTSITAGLTCSAALLSEWGT